MTIARPITADEVTSIVIETGSAFTRAGFSGEYSPKFMLPTPYGKDSNNNYYFDENQLNDPIPDKEVYSPLTDGCIHDWNAISKYWRYIYDEKFKLDPTEWPFVTTEHIWNPAENKKRVLELAFEDLQVPIFSLLKSPLCATYESGRPTGLVIDVGASVASVTPVVEGNIMTRAAYHSRFAGDFLNLHLVNQLEKQRNVTVTPAYKIQKKVLNNPDPNNNNEPVYKNFPEPMTESFDTYQTGRILTEFKESTLQVSDIPFDANNPQMQRLGNRPFEFPTGHSLLFGTERFTTTEPLFKPFSYPIDGLIPQDVLNNAQGISQLVNASLSKVIDASSTSSAQSGAAEQNIKSLLSNVIITGGTSLLQGFVNRIEFELSQYYPTYQLRFTVSQNAAERKSTTWTGASILASLGNFGQEQAWITKQDYEEYGSDLGEKRFK